eukprot:773773_1
MGGELRQRIPPPNKFSFSKRQQFLPKYARIRRTYFSAIPNNSPNFHKTKGVIFFLCACPFIIYVLSVHIVHTGIKNPNHDDSLSSLQSSHREDAGKRHSSDTVIGVGVNLKLEDYSRFVGSLRQNGFSGNIIIGFMISRKQGDADEEANTEIMNYLSAQKVMVRNIDTTECNITGREVDGKEFCVEGHPNVVLNSGEESYFFVKE